MTRLESGLRWMIGGSVSGSVVVLDEPLSFWGGFDPETGLVIDERHPQLGADLSGRILVMPAGRGSSSASSVLAEAIRLGTAPAAIIMASPDEIVVLGAIVADEMYGRVMPVGVADDHAYDVVSKASALEVGADGRCELR